MKDSQIRNLGSPLWKDSSDCGLIIQYQTFDQMLAIDFLHPPRYTFIYSYIHALQITDPFNLLQSRQIKQNATDKLIQHEAVTKC